jgi:hypothetical protein
MDQQCAANYYGFSSCTLCPFYTTSAVGSAPITHCKCTAGFTGPDGGPCAACAAGFYKATIGSAACTDCSTSSICQCGVGTAGITPTPPLPNATRDAVIPNYCTPEAGVPISRVASLVPYGYETIVFDACIPGPVRNLNPICDVLIMVNTEDEVGLIYFYDIPCTTITIAPGHIRLILNNSFTPQPANPATIGKSFPGYSRRGSGFRIAVYYLQTPRTGTASNQQCGGSLCKFLCPTFPTTVTTDPCHQNFFLTSWAHSMRFADPPSINMLRTSATEIRITWSFMHSAMRGYGNMPPTTLYQFQGFVVQLDSTAKFDDSTRITKFCPITTELADCHYDNRIVIVSGLDPTKTYLLRAAGRTIIGDGNYAGPFLVPVPNTEVPFASSSLCEQCAVGTYKTSSTQFSNNQACDACPANTSVVAGSSSVNNCLCMQGFAGPAGGPCTETSSTASHAPTTTTTTPEPTTTTTTPEPTTSTTPEPTTTTTTSELTTTPTPQPCNAGYTGPDGAPCAACVVGKYKTVTGSATCTNCGAGKYSTVTSSTSESACQACWQNSYSTSGSTTCQCNNPTFAEFQSAASCSICSSRSELDMSRLLELESRFDTHELLISGTETYPHYIHVHGLQCQPDVAGLYSLDAIFLKTILPCIRR